MNQTDTEIADCVTSVLERALKVTGSVLFSRPKIESQVNLKLLKMVRSLLQLARLFHFGNPTLIGL